MKSEKKLDRRVIRTRRMLRDAFLELIVERGYENLTITEITERADVRRATFYLHYKDIDELLRATLKNLFDEFAQELQRQQMTQSCWQRNSTPSVQAILDYIVQHHALYDELLTGAAGAKVQRYLRDYLAEIKRQDLAVLPPERLPAPPEVIANYVAGAETVMICWWLENDRPYSAERMAHMIQNLLLDGIGGFGTLT